MKRMLMAVILAASAFGWTGAAMAAHTGNRADLEQSEAAHTPYAGQSGPSYGQQSAAQYNQDNGQ